MLGGTRSHCSGKTKNSDIWFHFDVAEIHHKFLCFRHMYCQAYQDASYHAILSTGDAGCSTARIGFHFLIKSTGLWHLPDAV